MIIVFIELSDMTFYLKSVKVSIDSIVPLCSLWWKLLHSIISSIQIHIYFILIVVLQLVADVCGFIHSFHGIDVNKMELNQ